MDQATLERDFKHAFAYVLDGEGGTSDALLAFCHDDGTFIADDLPYPLDKGGFAGHMAFHDGGLWDKRQWAVKDVAYKVDGGFGRISCYYNMRGKPTHSGFRQRPGFCTIICAWQEDTSKWQALNIQMSPLLSQVLDASPG